MKALHRLAPGSLSLPVHYYTQQRAMRLLSVRQPNVKFCEERVLKNPPGLDKVSQGRRESTTDGTKP
jgi:hypothetical protein